MPSCKLFRQDASKVILPEVLSRLTKDEQLPYSKLDDENQTPLFLYFRGEGKNRYGVSREFDLDRPLELWSRDRGVYFAKVTVPISTQFFGGELSPLVAVFASRWNSVLFADAIVRLCHGEQVLQPVAFDLSGKSEEIRRNFPDVKKFKAVRLRDDMEKDASIGGMQLDRSDAWTRYIGTMHGELTRVVIKVDDTYVELGEDGTLRFRSQDGNVAFVNDFLLNLKQLGIYS